VLINDIGFFQNDARATNGIQVGKDGGMSLLIKIKRNRDFHVTRKTGKGKALVQTMHKP
jgi:hypothetical protein